MFDLPVVEKAEQKAANRFRNALLDMGFEMAQFSVPICGSAPVRPRSTRMQSQGGVGLFPKAAGEHLDDDRQAVRADRHLPRSRTPRARKAPDQFDLF